jgi:hypothetical protein
VPLILAAELSPEEAAPLAEAMLGQAKASGQQVGRAAIALAIARGDDAAAPIWKALEPRIATTDDTTADLVFALSRCHDPKVTEKIQARLKKCVGRAPGFRTAKAAAGAVTLAHLLAALDHAPAAELLDQVRQSAKDYDLRVVASEALSRFSSEDALRPLATEWRTAPEIFDGHAVTARLRLDPATAYDELADAVGDEAVESFARMQKAKVILQALTQVLKGGDEASEALRADERWLDRCRALLASNIGFVAQPALAAIGSEAAVAAIVDGSDHLDLDRTCEVLVAIDRRLAANAAKVIRQRAKKREPAVRDRYLEVAEELGAQN